MRSSRKVLSAMAVLFMLTGCASQSRETAVTRSAPQEASAVKVGIAMPTRDLQRWNQDAQHLKQELEKLGYAADIQFAGNDPDTQISQISKMIDSGDRALIIACVDSNSLSGVLERADDEDIPVVAYDRLIMDTDAVDCYASFDNYLVGYKQGTFIKEKLDLDHLDRTYNIEIFSGDMADNNSRYFYEGAMDVLSPYIEEGKLVVPSGKISQEDTQISGWETFTAKARMDEIRSMYYKDGTVLDAVLCPNDTTALGVIYSLTVGYNGSWPIITGQDCDTANISYMREGKQAMDIFKDTRKLAVKAAEMTDDLLGGREPSVNDTESYDNGSEVIPAYLCEPMVATADNYWEILVESGYYNEEVVS